MTDPAASAWQKPSGWQLNLGPQQWSAQLQAQSSNWKGSFYQSSSNLQPHWSSNQYNYDGSYKKNPQQE
eukprot:1649142-Amphidinium_carterae.1